MTRVIRRPAHRAPAPPPEPTRSLVSRDELDWVTVEVDHLAAPQGSHRQGFGKSVKESNPRTEPYREAVADACRQWHDEHFLGEPLLLDGPLELDVVFRMMPAPASDPDRRYPHVAPDLDKLLRATCDGITRGQLWKDDARCTRVVAEKVHASSPETTGVTLRVRRRP